MITARKNLTTERQAELKQEIMREFHREGKVSMRYREQLAKQWDLSIASISKYVGQLEAKYQHQWTDDERQYIWLHYEELGPQALAEKYHTTRRAIIQQVSMMRKANNVLI